MAFIKQEPFSEEQWDQLIKEFENQPDSYFPDYQNTIFDQDRLSANDANDQGLYPAADQAEGDPSNTQVDWAFLDPANQSFEKPADKETNTNPSPSQVLNKLDEIRALLEDNTRQISGIHQHLAGLHPFFQAMRATLKALTQHINPQWEVKTPTTPVKMQYGKPSDGC